MKNNTSDYIRLAQATVKIARNAGQAILEIYNHAGDFAIEMKTDKSPLTLADNASNQFICKELANLKPAFPIISEENKQTGFEIRRHWESCWLVDPLDGTKEFIKRNGDFTVNIALLHRGSPVLGVVYAPCLDELCWAVKNQGAFMIRNGVRSVLEAAEFKPEDEGLNIVCSRSHLTKETEDFIARFREPNLVSRGSSLKFLLLAKGDAHVYPRIAPTMEWDTAAAQIILEEAGGKVVHFESGEPLLYNKEDLRNPAFIAYGRVC
jgi:3'(2'), 5'-bisphosphate nucleotidase